MFSDFSTARFKLLGTVMYFWSRLVYLYFSSNVNLLAL